MRLIPNPNGIKIICAHPGGILENGYNPFHAFEVHPSQILVLKLPPKPNFAFWLDGLRADQFHGQLSAPR